MFNIIDPIYYFSNNIEIHPIIQEIIKTPEFIRLKGIKQGGITGLFTQRTYDRYEHSVGVFLLLTQLGATFEQCIGGLLHDIYHTNFSHTTDELLCGETQESFHEKNKFIFFDKCCQNIKNILKTNFPNRDSYFFLEGENLMITKNKSFGADMLDYFMRDGYYENIISIEWITDLIHKIQLVNGRIVLQDITKAKDFFNKTILINDTVYMSPFSRGQYKIFMHILKIALQENIITVDEIVYNYFSDIEIYEKIKYSNNEQINILINLLETTTLYTFINNDPKLKKTKSKINRKLRFLNPICNQNGECSHVISDIDKEIGKILNEKKKQYEKQEELYIAYSSSPPI